MDMMTTTTTTTTTTTEEDIRHMMAIRSNMFASIDDTVCADARRVSVWHRASPCPDETQDWNGCEGDGMEVDHYQQQQQQQTACAGCRSVAPMTLPTGRWMACRVTHPHRKIPLSVALSTLERAAPHSVAGVLRIAAAVPAVTARVLQSVARLRAMCDVESVVVPRYTVGFPVPRSDTALPLAYAWQCALGRKAASFAWKATLNMTRTIGMRPHECALLYAQWMHLPDPPYPNAPLCVQWSVMPQLLRIETCTHIATGAALLRRPDIIEVLVWQLASAREQGFVYAQQLLWYITGTHAAASLACVLAAARGLARAAQHGMMQLPEFGRVSSEMLASRTPLPPLGASAAVTKLQQSHPAMLRGGGGGGGDGDDSSRDDMDTRTQTRWPDAIAPLAEFVAIVCERRPRSIVDLARLVCEMTGRMHAWAVHILVARARHAHPAYIQRILRAILTQAGQTPFVPNDIVRRNRLIMRAIAQTDGGRHRRMHATAEMTCERIASTSAVRDIMAHSHLSTMRRHHHHHHRHQTMTPQSCYTG